MIPAERIDVETDPIPGRLRITVRRNDPWQHPLTHPAIDPGSPYARYAGDPATCRKPLVIGGDPETGAPAAAPAPGMRTRGSSSAPWPALRTA